MLPVRYATLFAQCWLLVVLCGLLGARQAAAAPADSLLTALNQALTHQSDYDNQRWQQIHRLTASFKAHRADDAAKFALGLRVYEAYKAFKHDSAFVYCQKLRQLAGALGSPEKREAAQLRLAFVLLSAGLFKETFTTLAGINPRRLPPTDWEDYYFTQARAYNDLAYFNQDEFYRPDYLAKSRAYADTALRYCPPGSYQALSVRAFQAQQTNNLAEGVAVFWQLRQLPLTQHQLAIATSTLANVYSRAGQEDQAFELLLESALADVKSATKETVAMSEVANYCYRRGDLADAYAFIKEAQREAVFYKARQRQVQISEFSSVIEGKKIDIIERQRQAQRTYVLAVTVLALFVAAFAAVIFRQLRKLRKAGRLIAATVQELRERNANQLRLNQELTRSNHSLAEANAHLAEANRIKEEYIGYYFQHNTQYLSERETLKSRLDVLLSTKQYAGLQKLADGINVKKERSELFKGFDTVFLRLFPHFVDEFNALFREEDRIRLDDTQLLTAELRIFALIRLGIDDGEQISQMLGYSINTIYTYKTRVRNRAIIPKEEFDARIKAIEAV
ncbi:MAG: tetratricopeptide repeat protein [Hymenobacter sp.]|nr:MAG: tetratricopeptide repeat protein [Hymenobacter sp.]